MNYNLIPEHCREGMRLYMEHGILPGDFMQAVISNNLVEAFFRADDINVHRMLDYAHFLYWEAPSMSWGSEDKMYAWAKKQRDKHELMEIGGLK